MKKMFLLLLVCSFSVVSLAQTVKPIQVTPTAKASVEKSIFSIQAGPIGIWINNEARLSRSLVLRAEIGYAARLLWGAGQEEGFLTAPVFL